MSGGYVPSASGSRDGSLRIARPNVIVAQPVAALVAAPVTAPVAAPVAAAAPSGFLARMAAMKKETPVQQEPLEPKQEIPNLPPSNPTMSNEYSNSNKNNLNLLSNSGLGNYRNNANASNSVKSGNKPMTGSKNAAMMPNLDDLEDMDDLAAPQKASAGGLGDMFGSAGIPTLDVGGSRQRYASRPSN